MREFFVSQSPDDKFIPLATDLYTPTKSHSVVLQSMVSVLRSEIKKRRRSYSRDALCHDIVILIFVINVNYSARHLSTHSVQTGFFTLPNFSALWFAEILSDELIILHAVHLNQTSESHSSEQFKNTVGSNLRMSLAILQWSN